MSSVMPVSFSGALDGGRSEDEAPAPPGAGNQPLPLQRIERLAQRLTAYAELLAQGHLGRQTVARLHLREDLFAQQIRDLHVLRIGLEQRFRSRHGFLSSL